MIDGQNFFQQPVKNNLRTYDGIQKISTGQGDDYATGCLLDYNYWKKYYRRIVNNKHLMLIQKTIQQINFIGNSARAADGNNVFHY